MIVVIDYGMGNIGSILNMLKRVGAETKPSGDPAEIRRAEKVILPGVGAFDSGVQHLKSLGLLEPLHEVALHARKPVLGICLGMQIMTQSSEEGVCPGLGWLNARTIRFRSSGNGVLKIPHMGWNDVRVVRPTTLFAGLEQEARFYFVHSYHVVCEDRADVAGETDYGLPFVSAVRRGNILGTQFHPEKSRKYGMALLRNFAEMA